MMSLFQLFLHFVKYGMLCFGGGYMLIPLMTADLVGPEKMLTEEEFSTLVPIAQMTPGPIGVNTATYTGYIHFGISGGIITTAGLAVSSLLLVVPAAGLLRRYAGSKAVRGFLRGMHPASFGLILSAAVIFIELSVFSHAIEWSALWTPGQDFSLPSVRPVCLLICAATFLLLKTTKIPFMPLIIASAALGAVFCA